jgi:uncharacterized membrane protein YccC
MVTQASGAPGQALVPKPQFWATVLRFQKEKLRPQIALRNSLGVFFPLAMAVATGEIRVGVVVALGALNVSYSDSYEPYVLRVRRMLAASVLVGVAVLAGELSGGLGVASVIAVGAWGFIAGMLGSLGSTAGDLGVVSLVTLVVFAATPQPVDRALASGAWAVLGGVLQTGLSVLLWPVRRHVPERETLATVYDQLAKTAGAAPAATEAPPASAETTEAQNALRALSDHSVESERHRLLLSQAERMRLALLTLARLCSRIRREHPTRGEAALLDRYREIAAELLASIARALRAGEPAEMNAACLQELRDLADRLRHTSDAAPPMLTAMLADARTQMDALTGQLRSALDLAAFATPEGLDAFVRREQRRPWRLRLQGTVATLRANLSLQSASFRHAVRLAVCVALGDALGRGLDLRRSYWIPMTIAIVLKPDFTGTFSRGLLRLAGTFAGLVLATGLFHVLPASAAAQVIMVALLMLGMRWIGPANYGIFVMMVTAMVVFLIGLTGVSPKEVMGARGLNTAVGGLIALAAYAAWPTWERTVAPEQMARMLDAYRDYFRTVREAYMRPAQAFDSELDHARLAARLARSNAQASIDRLMSEPLTGPESIGLLTGMMASSHRLAHAMMALEAGLASSHPVPARAPFAPFANAVELTLHSLASALRRSPLRANDLPDLREAHYALVHSGDSLTERYALVNVETDRITNSLNTLTGEILRWIKTTR